MEAARFCGSGRGWVWGWEDVDGKVKREQMLLLREREVITRAFSCHLEGRIILIRGKERERERERRKL